MKAQSILSKGKLKRFLTINGRDLHIVTTNSMECEHLFKAIRDQMLARGWSSVQTQEKYISKRTVRPAREYVKRKILGLTYRERDGE